MAPRVCAEHVEASPQTSGEAIRSIYLGLPKGYGIGSADERRVDSPRMIFYNFAVGARLCVLHRVVFLLRCGCRPENTSSSHKCSSIGEIAGQ